MKQCISHSEQRLSRYKPAGFLVRIVLVAAAVLLQGRYVSAQYPVRPGSGGPQGASAPDTNALFEPREGVLLLRNSNLLAGFISRQGDRYAVAVSKSGEVQIPIRDVDAVCGTPEEAYRYLRERLHRQNSPTDSRLSIHLKLAEWCLRHELLGPAADEILEIGRHDPDHPALSRLQRRVRTALDRIREQDRGILASTDTEASGKPSAEATEEQGPPLATPEPLVGIRYDDLSVDAVAQFTSQVQPMLLNKCATNRCHGTGSTSEFQLIYPTWTRIIPQRFTQRNLASALRQLDATRPEASPLLQHPLRPHGGLNQPVFGPTEQAPLVLLANWVEHVTRSAQSAPSHRLLAPQTTPTQGEPVRQASFEERPRGGNGPQATEPPQAGLKSNPSGTRLPGTSLPDMAAGDSAGGPFVSNRVPGGEFRPRDEFDPEIFNRRYHGR